jgi:hypothetical protein
MQGVTQSHAAAVSLAFAFIAGGGCASEGEPVSSGGDPILGGASDTSTPEDNAVVLVSTRGYECTGVLVTPNVVLTADHCRNETIAAWTPPLGTGFRPMHWPVAIGVGLTRARPRARASACFWAHPPATTIASSSPRATPAPA